MIALWEDADMAPKHAISIDLDDLARLREAAGILVRRDRAALTAQPAVEHFKARLEGSVALLKALTKHQWGIKAAAAIRPDQAPEVAA